MNLRTFNVNSVFIAFVLFYRMRKYIQRGSVSSRIEYARLRDAIWNEVYSLDKEGVVLHDSDIQRIAMIKAKERSLHDFKVSMRKLLSI